MLLQKGATATVVRFGAPPIVVLRTRNRVEMRMNVQRQATEYQPTI